MIRLENITKVYPARGTGEPFRAVDDISLDIAAGEIFGIIGRSGAGKSTLLRTVNRLESPTSGRVWVDGVDITGLDGAALRRQRHQIGMIFQHFNLLSSRTVFDNVALPLELAGTPKAQIRSQIEPLLELVGLSDKRDRYPAELSGGQKQRVGIARALASKPKVLLSDEATSALDPETTMQILHLLADINRRLGLTIVLITHEIGVIKEICHKVAVLDGGRLIETGPVFDIFAHPKHPITHSFVDPVINRGLPDGLAERLVPAPADARAAEGLVAVLRITFTGEQANSPFISTVSRRLDIDVNLLHGQIDEIRNSPFGTLVVEVPAAPATVDAVSQLIRLNNLGVEVLGYAVPGNHRAAG